jgi:CTP:molybdopterin cytidylyltransferase MocA
MHSPGICGVILASSLQAEGSSPSTTSRAEVVGHLVDALNADTDMVLVAVGAQAEALTPVVWAKAAYMVQLAGDTSDADALRAALREVLNRGRDAALVAVLDDLWLTAETVHRMVAAYCAAGDEVWAVVPEIATRQAHPVLMGRTMIELFLRGTKWNSADELVSAHWEHVRGVNAADQVASGTVSEAPKD